MRKALALALALLSSPFSANAQVQWSGTLDIAHKVDIAQDDGEADTHVNRSLKGLSPFNLVRARLFADAQISDDVAVLTTVLWDEGLGHFDMEGAYLLFSGVGGREHLNAQVGKMATPFGRFASRSFATVNPLIGTPLIYHYFTSVRGNSVPSDASQQLAWRDTRGAAYQTRGLPTIYDACWNTGVQLFGSTTQLAYALAVTKGALSNPASTDNDGVQVVGRIGVQPTMSWQIGLSFAWGPYLQAKAADSPAFPAGRQVEDYRQRVIGFDTAYSRGRIELTAEVLHNRWQVPNLGDDLRNIGGYADVTVGLRTGFNWTARVGHIGFSEIDESGRRQSWDYDVTRLETGPEYYLDRAIRLKGVVQLNWWDGAPDDADHLVGVQLASQF